MRTDDDDTGGSVSIRRVGGGLTGSTSLVVLSFLPKRLLIAPCAAERCLPRGKEFRYVS